jgi:hypothetical protein
MLLYSRGDLGLYLTPDGVPDCRTLYSGSPSLVSVLGLVPLRSAERDVGFPESDLIPEGMPAASMLPPRALSAVGGVPEDLRRL